MRSMKGDKGQIYTMEGITASLIILGVLLFIIQANSLVVPQTAKVMDMKLSLMANDVLTNVDWNSNDSWGSTGSLQSYVANWNGQSLSTTDNSPQIIDPGLKMLDSNISAMLPTDVKYNIEFFYNIHYLNGSVAKRNYMVIRNGVPGDNSMVSSRLVTLNDGDIQSTPYWSHISDTFPQVVEVRITCWYL